VTIQLLRDISTVAWKDLKVSLRANRRVGGVLYMLVWAALFSVGLPVAMGGSWLTSPEVLFIWAWLPFYVMAPVIGGAIAGERELHTLETVLATRLSDRAILLGKIAAGALYGWAYALISIVCSPLVVAMATGNPVRLYSPAVAVGGPLISLLGAVAGASMGVLISVRATTNREAQDGISLALMGLTIPFAALRAGLQELGVPVADILLSVNGWLLDLVFVAALGLVSLVVVCMARARFVRTRLLQN
jgi:ABC-2 type transport system permease protein